MAILTLLRGCKRISVDASQEVKELTVSFHHRSLWLGVVTSFTIL
jgi:hypothetical protein